MSQSTSEAPTASLAIERMRNSPSPRRSERDGVSKTRSQKYPAIYKCNLCSNSYTRNTTLVEHRRTHSNERPFQCSFCAAAFGRRKEMKRHEASHTNEKKHVCLGSYEENGKEVTFGCCKGFSRKDALNEHRKARVSVECLDPRAKST